MSLSLSSLLNPEPSRASKEQQDETISIATRQSPSHPLSSSTDRGSSPAHEHSTQLPEGQQQRQSHAAQRTVTATGDISAQAIRQHEAEQASQYVNHAAVSDIATSRDGERGSSLDVRPGSSGGCRLLPPPPPPPPLATTTGKEVRSRNSEGEHRPQERSEQSRRPSVSSGLLPEKHQHQQHNLLFPPLTAAGQTQRGLERQRVRIELQSAVTNGTVLTPDSSDAPHVKAKTHSTEMARDGDDTATETHLHSPPTMPSISTSNVPASMDGTASPVIIKQETVQTPPVSSPIEARRDSTADMDLDHNSLNPLASLKPEHGMRNPSPLRDSSVPMPSTETAPVEQKDKGGAKKRPAVRTKKGTASISKKAPPAKKRKIEAKRSETPASTLNASSKTSKSKQHFGSASPAPSRRSQSVSDGYDEDEGEDDEEGVGSEDDGNLYCLCRKPDTGTFMIGCDGTCDDWFHGKCVGVDEKDKHLIDKYICPGCVKAGVGRTTWKRLCRRVGCRQPARATVKGRAVPEGSKYCSEECGIIFFREMLAGSRGNEGRSRRKSTSAARHRAAQADDVGAKGGLLAAGEVKSLLDASRTAEEFRKLGEGVLSPPATPDGKKPGRDAVQKEKEDIPHTEAESAALARIKTSKDEARKRHVLLKDRMKFVSMAKQAAARGAEERGVKQKEYCGYDGRLEWGEAQFETWRNSAAGKQAFDADTLEASAAAKPQTNGTAMDVDVEGEEDAGGEPNGLHAEVCERKKCARHYEWAKLAVDDLRFEMGDNSDAMRALEREEREIRERAALRASFGDGGGGAEGSVEVHDLPSGPPFAVLSHALAPASARAVTPPVTVDGGEAMDIDVPAIVRSVEAAPDASVVV